MSEKITIRALAEPSQSQGQAPGEGDIISTGWAINISRSGVRAILEERVLAGVDYAVTVGEDGTSQLTRRARVVWVQEEHDGVVVGLEFASQSGMHKAAPGAVPGDSVPADAVPEDASPEGAGEEKGDGENT